MSDAENKGPIDGSSSSSSTEQPEPELVIIDWNDLIVLDNNNSNHNVQVALHRGFTQLGIVAVRNVPKFLAYKQQLFPMIHILATKLSDDDYMSITNAESLYNTGWSHGKEMIRPGKPDVAKASYYYNPLTDLPGTELDRKLYPLSYPPNIWPSTNCNDKLPTKEFQDIAKEMGRLLTKVCLQIAKCMDDDTNLHAVLDGTDKVKARLLYYYPTGTKTRTTTTETGTENTTTTNNEEEEETPPPTPFTKEEVAEDSWIGWHNDSGFLTALAGDWYVDSKTGNVLSKDIIDDKAGLYIEATASSSTNVVHKVNIPDDCCAVQIGECSQILTGGRYKATPHCVRAASASPDTARISMAVFVDTKPNFKLYYNNDSTPQQEEDEGETEKKNADVELQQQEESTRVPPLSERWENGMTFGDFLQRTFEMYYNWK